MSNSKLIYLDAESQQVHHQSNREHLDPVEKCTYFWNDTLVYRSLRCQPNCISLSILWKKRIKWNETNSRKNEEGSLTQRNMVQSLAASVFLNKWTDELWVRFSWKEGKWPHLLESPHLCLSHWTSGGESLTSVFFHRMVEPLNPFPRGHTWITKSSRK